MDESGRTIRLILGLSIIIDLISGLDPEIRLMRSMVILVFLTTQRVSFSNLSTPMTFKSGIETERLGNDLNRFILISENSTLAFRLLFASFFRRSNISPLNRKGVIIKIRSSTANTIPEIFNAFFI